MASVDPALAARTVRRRQRLVMGGLLLTFLGLLLISALLPVGSKTLLRAVPLAAAGVAALWAGGILLGLGSPRRDGRR